MNKVDAFEIGRQAAARAGNCSPRYVCPLCLRSFIEFDPQVLTAEHVPAAALGGKELVLTCRLCNSKGGERVQGHQTERERHDAFWKGEQEKPFNIEVDTPLGTIRGQAVYDGLRHVTLEADLKRMDPKTIATFQETPQTLTYRNYRVGRPFDWHKARVADLRDAYLWVFARWGYCSIAFPAFDWVRQAIRDGKTTQQRWSINLNDPHTKELQERARRGVICFLTKPHGAILVCHKKSGIILPTFFNANPYADLDDDIARLEFAPYVEAVPEFMHLGLDFSDHLIFKR